MTPQKYNTTMKKTLFIVLLLGICHLSFAQDSYNVINIKGKVNKNGKTIRRGQKLTASDKIKFVSPRAMLLVSSQKYGRMVLSANPRKKNVSETSYILKNLVSKGRASARGNAVLFNKTMIWTYFGRGTTKHLIIGEEEKVTVSKKAFPMNKDSFFFIHYKYKGEDVNKKLRFNEDASKFIINKDRLFRIHDKKISGEGIEDFKMFYYVKGKEPVVIGDIKMAFFDDNSENKKAIHELAGFMKEGKMGEKEIRNAVFAYLARYFGEPNGEEFNHWFKKNFHQE